MNRTDNDQRHRDYAARHSLDSPRRGSRDDPYRYSQSFGNPQFGELRGYAIGSSGGGDFRDEWGDRDYEDSRQASRGRYADEFSNANYASYGGGEGGRYAQPRDQRFDRYSGRFPDSPQGLNSGEWRDQYRDGGGLSSRNAQGFDRPARHLYGWQPLDTPHPRDFDREFSQDRYQDAERYAQQVRQGRPDLSPPEPRRQTPKGYTRSDSRIEDDICEHLYHANDIDVAEISVTVKNGTVSLSGTVPERRMKHRIEDICERCIGVTDVENRIRVGTQSPATPQGTAVQSESSTGRSSHSRKEGGGSAAH